MQCVLVGNYGAKNIGDEALKEYFLSAFPEIEWIVVGADVPRLPFGVRSFFRPWFQTIAAIARSKAVVFGGGSLFTDVESVKACMMWASYVLVARILGKPVFLAAQGIGPFRIFLGLVLAQWSVKRASFISVRDEESLARLKDWKLSCTPILTFDPAFARFGGATAGRPAFARGAKGRGMLVLIPRTNSDETFFAAFQKALNEKYDNVRILLMQPDDAEKRVGERLQFIAGPASVIVSITSVGQLLDEVSSASFVIAQRYHGALAALALDVPFEVIPQSERDKMWSLRGVLAGSATKQKFLALVEAGEDSLKQALKKL